MTMITEVKVYYKTDGEELLDVDFDNKVRDFMEEMGLKFYESSFNFVEGVRDVAYQRRKK